MPVYEYKCKACSQRFEALRAMNQMDAPIACPKCGSETVQRAVSVFAAISREAGGGSRMVASSTSSAGCSGCAGGHCSSCGH